MLDKGNANEPAREARVWLRTHPNDPDAYVALGQAAQLNGDYRASLSFLQATYAANPLYRNVPEKWGDDARRFLHRFPGVHLRAITVRPAPGGALRAKAINLLNARKYDAIESNEKALLRSRAKLGIRWAAFVFAGGLWDAPDNEASWRINHARLEAWHKARPHSLLATIALARSWTQGAGIARGEEYASQTPAQNLRTMNARLRQAVPLFRSLAPHIRETPLVFSGLQHWGLLAQMPRRAYFTLFQQAQAAFPSYEAFPIEASTFLLPRWYGRRGEWERFADAQAKRVGGVRGEIVYADIASDKAFYFRDARKETSAPYARVKRGLQMAIHSGRDPLADATTAFVVATRWHDNAWARQLALGPLRSQIAASELSLSTFNILRVIVFRKP